MEVTSGTDELVSGELVSAAHAPSLSAESYGNHPDFEIAWAMTAMQHAEVYWKLISSADSQFLKLTKVNNQIYSEFWENVENLRIDVLNLDKLKSKSAKEKWRPSCLKFDGIVEDFSCGTLLQLDCSQGYTEENTIFAPRIQFFAIEIARNQEGHNKAVYTSVQDKEEEKIAYDRGNKRADRKGENEEASNGGEKEKKATKKQTKVVKQLYQIDREQHSRSFDSIEPTRTTLLLTPTPLDKRMFCAIEECAERHLSSLIIMRCSSHPLVSTA